MFVGCELQWLCRRCAPAPCCRPRRELLQIPGRQRRSSDAVDRLSKYRLWSSRRGVPHNGEDGQVGVGKWGVIGALPGFNDVWRFGRRQVKMNPTYLQYLVTYQIGATQAIARANGATVTHVEPHGGLNNMAHDDINYALAIGRGIAAADSNLIYVANAGLQMVSR